MLHVLNHPARYKLSVEETVRRVAVISRDGLPIHAVEVTDTGHYRPEYDCDAIRLDLPITLDEAVNGAKVKVPTPDGAVMLTVAPGTSSGKALRLKGKGFSRKDGTRGDQLVTIEVQLPEADEDLVRRLDGWRDSRNLRSRLGV